jgi:gamma-glutamylcyclotransferase (GGCT)/AIG2-like uncharacterized protein YtfP
MTVRLFVYGTLATGGGQEQLLGMGRRRPATAEGTLWSLPAGYPALQLTGAGTVYGERVDGVPEAALSVLDAYEGVADGLFRRVELPVLCDGARELVWAWVMDDPRRHRGRLVASGRWRPTRRRGLGE